MSMIARRFKISGKVQGVGFRYFVLEHAGKLGIKGTVRNLEDGAVLVEAEGNPEMMDEFFSYCSKGPYWSNVDKISNESIPFQGYSDFKIVR